MNWPSLKAEWQIIMDARTGHEERPPPHAGQRKGLAVERERKLTGLERVEAEMELEKRRRP